MLSPATESLIFIPYILSNVVSSALNEEGIYELYTLLEQFETFGFGDHYETDRLSLDMSSEDQSLHIHADPHLIARQTQKVRSQKMHAYKEKPTKVVEPSSCSAYLNVLFGERFNTTEYPAYTYAKREETANVDGVINLHNWVLQGFGYYQPVGGLKFNKGNVLLTRDFPQKEMRLSFGDINTMGIGFQNTIPMLGASIHKNGRLFTDATVGPASRHELFLNAPSTVEVFLDGIKLKTLQLRAGPHLLEEFPLFDGLNNVVLKIISPTGEERTLDLGYFYDLHELKSGESEYYFSLGVPAYSSASYQNLGNFPLVVGNFQYGFSDRLTAGTYLQALQGDRFVGGQASIYGSFYHGLLDFGASFFDKAQVKTRLYVSSVKKKKASSIDWQLTGEYMQPNFSY